MKLIIVLITGTAIFAFTAIIRILLNKLSQKYPSWRKLHKLYPIIGTALWTAFIFWGMGILFRDNVFYHYILMGIVLIMAGLITWFLLRDIFAGAVFRMQNDLNQDDYIKIGDISGQIKLARLTHLEVTSVNGQTIKIPNTRLSQELFTSTTTPDGMEEFNIHLLIDKRISKHEIEEKIKYELAGSPWCNYKNPPVVKLKNEDNDSYTYDVQVYTLNHQHLRMVEKILENKIENWQQ